MTCRACSKEGSEACTQKFTCIECGKSKLTCSHRVNGFDKGEDICDYCDAKAKGFRLTKTGIRKGGVCAAS